MTAIWTPAWPTAPAPGTVSVWRLDLDAWPADAPVGAGEAAQGARCAALRGARARAVRSGLRHLLGACVGMAPDALAFGTGPHGKPFLPDAPGLHFNLSHSDGLALVAVSADHEVGVDVERLRPVSDALGVARRVLGAGVATQLAALPPSEQQTAFFAAWTRHEALAKGLGLGLARPLPDVTGAWSVTPLPVPPGFCAALAGTHPGAVQCHTLLPV